MTATANTGYTFTNWTENGSVVWNEASFTFGVTGDRNLVANFSLNTYNVTATADPSEGGTVSGAGEYSYGESCTLTAIANEGYTFINWTENGDQVSSQAEYTFTVDGDRTLVAHFTSQGYIITAIADPEEGGTVTGGGEYVYGSTCTLVATANENYDFMGWYKGEDLASAQASYTFTVTTSETYVAVFSFNDSVKENTTISQIFPNPFTSKVSIKAEKVIKKVVVYDLEGRVVKVRGVSDTNVDLDMSDLSSGSYLLQLDYGNSRSIHRITKAN